MARIHHSNLFEPLTDPLMPDLVLFRLDMKLKRIARIRMCFKYSEAFQLKLEGQKHTERDPFTIPSFLLQSSPNSKVDSETGHAAWGATVIQKRESLRARSVRKRNLNE
ncbi:hypothetical protein Peur_002604 [Populus x canadensis]